MSLNNRYYHAVGNKSKAFKMNESLCGKIKAKTNEIPKNSHSSQNSGLTTLFI